MMKRTVFFLALVAMWQSVFAYDFSAVAPSGQTLYYNIVDGEAQVTCQKTSYPYYSTSPTGDLTIPSSVTYYDGTIYTVTSIGSGAFSYCSDLTSVSIPNSVISIGSGAFNWCSGLTSVAIGNSVTSIGFNAFRKCSDLTSVTIPNSVTSIGGYAFYGCRGLTSVTIPNSVTSIENGAFYGCSGLTSVTIPNSVTFIGYEVFSGCSGLTSPVYNNTLFAYLPRSYSGSYIIPEGITSICAGAFENCSSMTSVIIPNSMTYIRNYAFNGCSGLTSVIIPNSVTSIGADAFRDCSGLTSVTIPNSVTSIGDCAFSGCNGLTGPLVIPNSVTSIGIRSFSNCSGLTSVTIGNSVTTIEGRAFYNCSGILKVFCKSVYPPNCSISAFEGLSRYCKLIVPCGSLQYYQVADPWNSQFALKEEDCRTEYTITVASADENMGYVGGGGQVMEGDETTIYAISNPGYRFLRWNDNNTDSVRTVTVTGNATYTAYFAETVGVEDVADGEGVRVWSFDGRIHVVGAEGMDVNVYDILGRRVNGKRKVESGKLELAVPAGVYLVRIGDLPARKVVVIRR